jgi:hypothetical protein
MKGERPSFEYIAEVSPDAKEGHMAETRYPVKPPIKFRSEDDVEKDHKEEGDEINGWLKKEKGQETEEEKAETH